MNANLEKQESVDQNGGRTGRAWARVEAIRLKASNLAASARHSATRPPRQSGRGLTVAPGAGQKSIAIVGFLPGSAQVPRSRRVENVLQAAVVLLKSKLTGNMSLNFRKLGRQPVYGRFSTPSAR